MPEQTLVLFDSDRIHDYVFATGKLREIRGASALVRQLTGAQAVAELSGLPPWNGGEDGVIFAHGGAGALLFADEQQASHFCNTLETHVRHGTDGAATLTAVAVPVGGAQPEALRRAERRLAWRKASRPRAEANPGGGPIRFCASDRLRPASSLVREPGTAGLLVSEATALKREASDRYRDEFWSSSFGQALAAAADEPELVGRMVFHERQDLGVIGELATPRGYVAFVYIDGDLVGSLRRKVVGRQDLRGLQGFSAALQERTERATAEALAEAYGLRAPRHWLAPGAGRREAPTLTGWPTRPLLRAERGLPFELIMIGGDDVVLICTAEQGLAVACAITRRLGELMSAWLAEQGVNATFTASAGVVIAHATMPITLLERRAADLLRSAKSVAGGCNGIDFHVVTTPALDAISRVRERDYQPERKTRLTARPYKLDQAELLLAYTRLLRGLCDREGRPRALLEPGQRSDGLPRSKAADLLAACQGERAQATLDVLVAHGRLAGADRTTLVEALRDLGSLAYYPFGPATAEGVYATALPDLLELFEFVTEEGIWMSR